jgi:class 3 adenylate cyclase
MPNRDLKVSQERLWSLVEQRCQPGADVSELDRRIWDLFGEKWAVMFTDLSGFSRRVEQFGIIHFLQVIYEQRKLLLPIVERHDGLLIKEEGDSLLILFRRVERALEAGIAMQRACRMVNERRKPEEQILLCLGIGYGDILRIADQDAWGREVNSASKLGEDTANANEILVTAAAHQELAGRSDVEFESIGSTSLGPEENFRVLYR